MGWKSLPCLHMVYNHGYFPEELNNSIFITLPKISGTIKYEKHRTISLMSHITCFIDYSKAFDTVRHEPLIDLLKAIDVDSHDVQILENLYWKQNAAVRHNGEISEWMSIKQSVCQGCVASPHLFAMYTEMIMRSLEDKGSFRIRDQQS